MFPDDPHTGTIEFVVPESVQRLLPWYPELESAGDLRGMMQAAMDGAGFDSTVLSAPEPDRQIIGARLDDGTWSVRIGLSLSERAFIMRFWVHGVLMAGGSTADLAACAGAAGLWQCETTTRELRKVWPFVSDDDFLADAYERDPVAYYWAVFRTQVTYLDRHLVEAAYAQPRLRILFPCSGMGTLHLSRCTRSPFSRDVPSICPIDGRYLVLRSSHMPDGPSEIGLVDTAGDAAALVVAYLPDGCGPAINGTAEELRRSMPEQGVDT